ncbi:S15 peptidase family protein [Mycobacterium yunnanensis]|uniref:S15 peptidase family protein n=1 Tax=Mycobacterium yunnanensis TaxID=368477 RepID=UPI0021F3AFE0|nr:CocE/NonD family hydrolase [Mycobacterium yunnanensis]
MAAAARKETLVPAVTKTSAVTASTLAAPSALAAATPALVDTTPPVAVIQTPPLAWLQQIPVIGPVFVTPIVAAIHMIPIVGDIIHPFIGYPVQFGAPGAPVPRDVMITSFDGTQIYVHFMPAAGLPAKGVAPTILEGPGLGMPGSTSLEVTPLDGILTDALGAVGVGTLRHAGYNVVTWDPRGEYRSGGQLELDSADYEAKDVSAIISWLATQPEAQLDSPGDPRIGMVGASYGGGIQWTTAATDHRVDAIVPSISWNTLNTSLYKSDAFKSGWGSLLTAALLLTGARPNPEIYPAAIRGLLTGSITEEQQALLADRGPAALLGSVTAPALIIQGTVDTLFPLQEAQDNVAALAPNVPVKVLYFCGGHGLCTNNLFDPTDGQVVTDATLNWLARYVKGQNVSTGPAFEWVDQHGQYYTSNTYPSAAGAPIVASSGQSGVLPLVPLLFGSGPLFGVLPIGATAALNAVNVHIPTVATTTYVVGAPTLTLTYSGTGTSRHVFAQLVDDSTGNVLGNQATPIPVTLDGQTHTLSISMEQVAQTLKPGQTLTLQLVASTANYENFGAFGALTVSGLQVSLPTITDAVAVGAAPASVVA